MEIAGKKKYSLKMSYYSKKFCHECTDYITRSCIRGKNLFLRIKRKHRYINSKTNEKAP